MNIILMGYMGSGKSLIGQELSNILNMTFIDFDKFIEKNEGLSINNIFENKGEIYFRKVENSFLKKLLNKTTNSIISLGGGTPCYANNLELLKNKEDAKTIYLSTSVTELSKRLFQNKDERPLLKFVKSQNEMDEFVGKHVFERIKFYSQADITINANNSPEKIVEEIVLQLF